MTNAPRLARTTIRYPLEASVLFWWKDENGILKQEHGRGRDASDRGAFIVCAACPPLDTPIALTIFMEGLPGEAAALRIEVEGRVLRVERSESSAGNSGFAVLLSNAIVARSGAEKFFFTAADHKGKEN